MGLSRTQATTCHLDNDSAAKLSLSVKPQIWCKEERTWVIEMLQFVYI